MVAFFCPPPFMRPAASSLLSVEITYSANAGSGASITASFGDPAPGRVIIVTVSSLSNGPIPATAMTIGGLAATRIGGATGLQSSMAAFYAVVPTGTSGAVSATFGDTRFGTVFGVYRMVGNKEAAPLAASFPTGSGDAARSLTLASAPDACFIGVSAGTGGQSWTGAERLFIINDGQGFNHSGGRGYATASTIAVNNSASRVFGGFTWR